MKTTRAKNKDKKGDKEGEMEDNKKTKQEKGAKQKG
jgi:hypothetical protein